jgi:cold-inducible RNA-binding protein
MAVRLFVGNLPYSVTEVDLREHFSAVGPVSGVWLPTDRETGRPRGFGFVEFEDRAVAEEAIRRFNNQPLAGRSIAVNEARPPERGAGGPPRGGGSFEGPRPGGPPRDRPMSSGPPREGPRPPRPEGSGFGAPPPPGEFDESRGRVARPPKKNKKRGGRDFDRVRGPKGPIRAKSGGRFYSDTDEEDDQLDDLLEDELDEELDEEAEDELDEELDEEVDEEREDEPGDGDGRDNKS